MKRTFIGWAVSMVAALIGAVGVWISGGRDSSVSALSETIPLKEAKLIIEHNATAHDTGFQGFVDSEGWQNLEVRGPGGQIVLSFRASRDLGQMGLTELFFETVEPANADVPIEQVLTGR